MRQQEQTLQTFKSSIPADFDFCAQSVAILINSGEFVIMEEEDDIILVGRKRKPLSKQSTQTSSTSKHIEQPITEGFMRPKYRITGTSPTTATSGSEGKKKQKISKEEIVEYLKTSTPVPVSRLGERTRENAPSEKIEDGLNWPHNVTREDCVSVLKSVGYYHDTPKEARFRVFLECAIESGDDLKRLKSCFFNRCRKTNLLSGGSIDTLFANSHAELAEFIGILKSITKSKTLSSRFTKGSLKTTEHVANFSKGGLVSVESFKKSAGISNNEKVSINETPRVVKTKRSVLKWKPNKIVCELFEVADPSTEIITTKQKEAIDNQRRESEINDKAPIIKSKELQNDSRRNIILRYETVRPKASNFF